MAKVQFNIDLDNKKYIMKFLPDYRVKIIQTGNGAIIVHYSSDTKVRDFMQYIKSLDFSKLKNNEIYTLN